MLQKEKPFQLYGKRSEKSPEVDAKAIEHELKQKIKGEVRFDAGSRALYATDGSNYRQVPIGVVVPKDEADIVAIVAVCAHYGAPLLSRGGGTSLAGQCCNVAVVMDMSKYCHHILEIDVEKKLAKVQPGVVLDNLRKRAEKEGLTFGPDPSTHNHCTMGGMIGNNSCGVHSIMSVNNGLGARTSDNVHELEIITHDGIRMKVGPTTEEELHSIILAGGRKGEIYKKLKDIRDKYGEEIRKKFPNIPRRVSGYNLNELLPENGFNVARVLSGTEGTCVTILSATLHLIPNPKARSLLVLGYPDIATAGMHVMEIMKYKPIGLEGLDNILVDFMVNRHMHVEDLKMLPEGKAWLLAEFEGDNKEDSDKNARVVMEVLKDLPQAPTMKLYDDPEEEKKLWTVRASGLGATAFVPGEPDAWEGWEDAAVPPEKLGAYLKEFRTLLDKYAYKTSLYGHFGQGCIHCRISFDLVTAEGLVKYRNFLEEASDLVVSYGGSISGEHGDGQSKAQLLPKMFGPEIIKAFREFKSAWDPKGLMNPGKVVDPYPILSNLRLDKDYRPYEPDTHFKYTADNGSFSRATLRCVGVGECRKENSGTMCPSYMVTKEEKHSTRGRAHLLFEMLGGEVLKNKWKDESVKESLDLCLSCKGCKGDCPVKVDMATYKAEFLSHYYEGKLRPLHAYVFGWINKWSEMGSKFPRLTNYFFNSAIFGTLLKKVVGIAPQRSMPEYAPEPFREWFNKRAVVNEGQPKVILWADTFNNYFHPKVAKAAVETLEYLNFQVIVPKAHLCCGRPLYDYGMLDMAKKYLQHVLENLREEIREGTPVIGLEPSCTSVFRDEMLNLFPNDEDAKRLYKNVFLLSEFLEKKVKNYSFPQLKRKAIVHGHCHHKAIMKMNDEFAVLKKLGIDYEAPDTGCCGMAGAFGFEKDHYDISVKVGERVLIPAVKALDEDKLIILNGFSCHEQVQQLTGKEGLHLAEIIAMAIQQGAGQNNGSPVEDKDNSKPRKTGETIKGGVQFAIPSSEDNRK